MTNGEKFKNKIIDKYQYLIKEKVIDGNRMNRAIKEIAYKYCGIRLVGESSTIKWLFEEYEEKPIKLTRLEYLLLKLFYEKDFRYLTRSAGGFLYINKGNNPPQKKDRMWFNCESYITYDVIDDLFQFVQWKDEKPRAIKDILDNCEVIEDADD